ncbi:DUF1641 domain-containing protein [Haloquadratum walsbyi]|jgi:Protein of unknown function (DUF1641).|uniref:DUF1641 domain-containing protein n=1 Tax=Haloquadratum walsbyi J07HQW2 TaxID=1238425 RepID=U1NGZ0_9EURY|nr:DUF1641 domain-containing protein [Haloquadratum walsbyi]ERG96133.1 MAG: hypothetical protein J07HQW2_02602 [Haloquadratum walsbyi J07HQW2]
MAKPADEYPDSATNGAQEAITNGSVDIHTDSGASGQKTVDASDAAALTAAIETHGEDLAAAIEHTDQISDALTTAIIVLSTADEEEIDYITDSASNLIQAADGFSTEGSAELATELGKNADDLSESLDTVVSLQRDGQLDDLAMIATAFADSLSSEEVEELSTMLETDGAEIVNALDLVLELQREGQLKQLLDLAQTLSVLEVDEDTARGLNQLLQGVSEAQRESEPVGLFGVLRQLLGADARAGIGYFISILKSQGRRLRE